MLIIFRQKHASPITSPREKRERAFYTWRCVVAWNSTIRNAIRWRASFHSQHAKKEDYLKELPKLQMKQMAKSICKPCQLLISKMLHKNPSKRPSVHMLIREPIIQEQIGLIIEKHGDLPKDYKKLLMQLMIKDSKLQVGAGREEEKESMICSPSSAEDNIEFAPTSPSLAKKNGLIPVQQQAIPPFHLFAKPLLDRLLSGLNQPLNKYTPKLNKKGNSRLNRYIRESGWEGMTAVKMNQKANILYKVKWLKFEGTLRGQHPALKSGIYYGQTLNRKRHGYGHLYTTDASDTPHLFECEWTLGIPTTGRLTTISDDTIYETYNGTINEMGQVSLKKKMEKLTLMSGLTISEAGGEAHVARWQQPGGHVQVGRLVRAGAAHVGGWKVRRGAVREWDQIRGVQGV
ncbi:hypothetical protein FGO68_gene5936 [Halteria grandinella]|uniref:Uncharacterized protein n=1 Tax=Halteria grandinella TaxID=5974 RepID=A0A8J8T421_HALGN|nr:hypothetical protein FGO68_gene5936 [Halteria grandinella]